MPVERSFTEIEKASLVIAVCFISIPFESYIPTAVPTATPLMTIVLFTTDTFGSSIPFIESVFSFTK